MQPQLFTGSLPAIHDEFNEHGFVLFRTGVTGVWILDLFTEYLGAVRGVWGKNYTVNYKPENSPTLGSISQSGNELLPHTDGSFEIDLPPSLLLQCVESDQPNYGISTLIDGWRVIECLTDTSRQLLQDNPFIFYRREANREVTLKIPIIESRGTAYQLRYRNDEKHPLRHSDEDVSRAFDELVSLINEPRFHVNFQLEPGDILWVNNHRMLHGRSALSGKRGRFMRRYWIQNRHD